jgi:hypothetical protein
MSRRPDPDWLGRDTKADGLQCGSFVSIENRSRNYNKITTNDTDQNGSARLAYLIMVGDVNTG